MQKRKQKKTTISVIIQGPSVCNFLYKRMPQDVDGPYQLLHVLIESTMRLPTLALIILAAAAYARDCQHYTEDCMSDADCCISFPTCTPYYHDHDNVEVRYRVSAHLFCFSLT